MCVGNEASITGFEVHEVPDLEVVAAARSRALFSSPWLSIVKARARPDLEASVRSNQCTCQLHRLCGAQSTSVEVFQRKRKSQIRGLSLLTSLHLRWLLRTTCRGFRQPNEHPRSMLSGCICQRTNGHMPCKAVVRRPGSRSSEQHKPSMHASSLLGLLDRLA